MSACLVLSMAESVSLESQRMWCSSLVAFAVSSPYTVAGGPYFWCVTSHVARRAAAAADHCRGGTRVAMSPCDIGTV